MWVLVWIHLMNGKLEHFQLGTFSNAEQCYAEKTKAKVLKKTQDSGVFCLQVDIE